MGLFNFNKKEKAENNTSFTSEIDFLEKFGEQAFHKQLNLYGILEDKAWNVDMDKEEICFGGSITLPIQALDLG